MEVEEPSKWAKSTESRIQTFFDDYLISSTITGVRGSMKNLLFSLYKKGNTSQRAMILKLILTRCKDLKWMGKASAQFLDVIKKILVWCSGFQEIKIQIFEAIFNNLQNIASSMIRNPNYSFYAFASNLIDFGNNQFKPYLLEANGCLNCFGCSEEKSQYFTKFDSFVDFHQVFTNKLEYSFKRLFEITDLSIVLKSTNKYKMLSISYLDSNKEYKLIKKYKPGENILVKDTIEAEGLLFEFEMPFSKRDTVRCLFCGNSEEINCVCNNCPRKNDKIEMSGKFKVIGADQQKISKQLCQDYQKLRDRISAIKNAHIKMESRQKISFNFSTDEMYQLYQRIINNLKLLRSENSSQLATHAQKNCFSCNYYQLSSIVDFLKGVVVDVEYLSFSTEQLQSYKSLLKACISDNQIQSIKLSLMEALAKFYLLSKQINYLEQFKGRQTTKNINSAEILVEILKSMKEKKKSEKQIESAFQEILTDANIINNFNTLEKIRLFVCYFGDWELLSQLDNITPTTEVNRLFDHHLKDYSALVKFNMSDLFNYNLDGFLKAFLKLLPSSMLPELSLDLTDSQFFHYIENKLPVISDSQIKENIIKSTRPMIRLDMFNSLPVLINELPIKDSMALMNKLFLYRDVWNLNIIQACQFYQNKLGEIPPEEQISLCLNGYHKCKEYLYIERIHKLLVPQRMKFIIRLQPPIEQIQRMSFEYPYIPIREVRSDELQGDTIQALHSWVYHELEKINQAMPLDIIVEKNIIDNMDLPIEVIFQNIVENKSKKTIGKQVYDFFRVIYRIQGILGEPKQRGIGNPRDLKLETCISYSSHFLNKLNDNQKLIGLDILIDILNEIKPGSESHKKKVLLFQILSTLSLNEGLCKKIIEGQYGDSIINATVRLMSFQNQRDAKITNFLLELSSKVIDQANQEMINLRKGSANQMRKLSGFDMDIENVSDSENKVRYVLMKFEECEKNFENTGNVLYRNIAKRLIKLLPFCSKDETEATNNLFNFFELGNWGGKSSLKMENLLIFMESLSESYMTFKKICRQSGITQEIITTIIKNVRKQGSTEIDETKLSNNRSIVESALLLLCSLIQGDEELQDHLFKDEVFHNIYAIAQIGPKKTQEIKAGKVPENCYKIIKYFTEGKIVDARISDFLKAKKEEQNKKKKPIKKQKWAKIKNKQAQYMQNKTMQEEQNDLIICSTCQEGYSKRKDVLGFYIYFTKNQMPPQENWWKDNRKLNSHTSTTFLTAIHYECHMRAYEADQKIPLGEWDGALIRNMDVLCNGWIPFKGPKTTNDEFSRVDRKYFERNKGGNFWNIINDMKSLLHKLSIEFDFAKESKGSSYSHNIRYLPVLISFGCYMIQKNHGQETIELGLKYFQQNPPTKISQILLLSTVALFYVPYKQFVEWKPKFVKILLDSKKQDTTDEEWFSENKKNFLFLKLVSEIFERIHKNVSESENGKNFHKQIEEYLQEELEKVVKAFEALGEDYKNLFTKFTTASEYF